MTDPNSAASHKVYVYFVSYMMTDSENKLAGCGNGILHHDKQIPYDITGAERKLITQLNPPRGMHLNIMWYNLVATMGA